MPIVKNFSMKIIISFIALLIGAVSVFTQETQDKRQDHKKDDDAATIRVDTDLVTLDVAVSDRDGNRSNAGLRVEDFAVYEDGARQRISSFDATEVPFNLVMLIDTSGSTRDDVGLIKKAARGFLNELRPQDRVAVIQFNKEVELLKDLTTDRRQIEDSLERLKPGTGTSFYDALQLTLEEVFNKVDGRKAIIALTDGVDSYGYNTYEKILPLLENFRVSAYFLELDTETFTAAGMMRDCADETHFEFSRKQLNKYIKEFGRAGIGSLYSGHCEMSRTERMQVNRQLYFLARRELREMADKTGGRVYPVTELKQLDSAYAQIAAELRTVYSLAYYPSNEKHDGKWRKIRIEIKRPGFVARTRPGYRAPKD
ncbi:MAG: VWA domain-containing protein [Blastocatellales bacterium]